MAATTIAAVRDMLGGIPGVADPSIQLAIDDAQKIVEGDGIALTDDRFEQLQRYYAGHNLAAFGLNREIASESVADVSRSFVSTKGTASSTGSSPWLSLYRKCLVKIHKLGDRIAIQ